MARTNGNAAANIAAPHTTVSNRQSTTSNDRDINGPTATPAIPTPKSINANARTSRSRNQLFSIVTVGT